MTPLRSSRWSQESTAPLHSTEAFNDLYERSHLIVFRYIFGLHGGPREAVEDLTAETYLRAWRARHRFEGDLDAALGWLLQIARNLVIDAHRRYKRHGYSESIDDHILPAPEHGPEAQLVLRQALQNLWDVLGELPTQQREIIVLRYMLGWRVKEIAAHLDMLENTVSQNIRRILKRLREKLES
jgi:RNA polymerase sigma-70 factor (ECF subfamily)